VLGATVNGDLNVQRNSSARLRNGATLNGNARVTEMSLLRGAGAGTLTITGFLECDTGTSYAYGISGTDVAGSYSLACNPPAGP
jgi:hypothetical protein